MSPSFKTTNHASRLPAIHSKQEIVLPLTRILAAGRLAGRKWADSAGVLTVLTCRRGGGRKMRGDPDLGATHEGVTILWLK